MTIGDGPESGWVLAVDFGTTATAAAVREPDGQVLGLVLADGAATMPSSVFADTTGLLVGSHADNASGYGMDRYEPTPKRLVGRAWVLLGDIEFRPVELVAAVYAAIIGEAVRQHNNTPPAMLVLTHPVAWTDTRLQVLREAAQLAATKLDIALPEPLFVPEPVAAASHYTHTNPAGADARRGHPQPAPGSCFAVYDLGGGTFDATVLRRTDTGFEVLASGGIDPLGGFDFDGRLFTYLGDTHSQKADPTLWRTLLVPDPDDHNSGIRRHALQTTIRQLKENLSDYTHLTIRLPGVAEPVLVTRAELESLIRPDLEATLAELEATVRRAGLTDEQLTGIYRIGGASRAPLVGALLDQLHRPVYVVNHPKTVVTLGATILPPTSTRTTEDPPPAPPEPHHDRPPTPATTPAPSGATISGKVLAAAAAAVIVLVVAAAALTTWILQSGNNTTTSPTGAPQAPIAALPPVPGANPGAAATTGAPPAPSLPLAAGRLLATADQVSQILGEPVHPDATATAPTDSSNIVTPPACAGAAFVGESRIYGSTGFTDFQKLVLLPAADAGNHFRIEELRVQLPSADTARRLVADTKQMWQDCVAARVAVSSPSAAWRPLVQDVQTYDNGDIIVQFMDVEGDVPRGYQCQHTIARSASVVAEAMACGTNDTIDDQAGAIVLKILNNG